MLANGLMARTLAANRRDSQSPRDRHRRIARPARKTHSDPRRADEAGEDLIVPLSRQADEIVSRAVLRNRGSEYMFPAVHRADRPMSENTILELIDRVGYKGAHDGPRRLAVASTWANESRIP